jgi:hypothetical protein
VAFGKRAGREKEKHDGCMCDVQAKRSTCRERIKRQLWGGFAIFHWHSFGEYLRTESEQQADLLSPCVANLVVALSTPGILYRHHVEY